MFRTSGSAAGQLRLALWLGILFCILGVIIGVYAIIRRFAFDELLMESFVMLYGVLFGSSGLFMILLGIFGEYLARVYTEIKGRPVYIISETNTK